MADAERFVIKHSAGWWMIVTVLFFLLPGIALMVGAPFLRPHISANQVGAIYAFFGLGLFMALFGVVLTFGRLVIVIDREQGTVANGYGIFGYSKFTVRPLDAFDAVCVSSGQVRSQHARYTRYRVHLVGPEVRVYLTEFTYQEQALSKAREVADFAGLPVADEADV